MAIHGNFCGSFEDRKQYLRDEGDTWCTPMISFVVRGAPLQEHPILRRKTDTDANKTIFRSPERVYVLNGEWYFSAREGDQGPFPSREAAEIARERYGAMMDDLADQSVETKPTPRRIVNPERPGEEPKSRPPARKGPAEAKREGRNDLIRGLFRD